MPFPSSYPWKNNTKTTASLSHSSKSECNTDWELKRNTNPRQHISLPESSVSDKITELLDPRLSRDFTGNRVSSAICRSLPDLLLPQHTTPHNNQHLTHNTHTQHQQSGHYTKRDVLHLFFHQLLRSSFLKAIFKFVLPETATLAF